MSSPAGPENTPAPSGRRRAGTRRTGRPSAARLSLLGGRTVAAFLSVLVLVVSAYTWDTYRTFQEQTTTVDIGSPKARKVADPDGADTNILLIGNDDRTGATPAELAQLRTQEDGGGVNTDTLVVLHIPGNGAKATGISIPRDSWVSIPGFGQGKINSAYSDGTMNGGGASGGYKLLIKTVENLTGLAIDHFVSVSLLGFYRIAEVLGPIQVCVNEAQDDPYSGTNLKAGINTLGASAALAFVRQRHGLPRGDLDREVRQQYFLSTEFRKISSAGTLLNPGKLQSLLDAVSKSIVKDTSLDFLKFAEQLHNLTAGKVSFATIPITGTPTIYPNGVETSIVAVDFADMPNFIGTVIGQPTAYDKAKTVATSKVTVQVVNASDTSGVAAKADTTLTALGFKVLTPGNATSTAQSTTIQYPAGQEAQAKTLAAHVPKATVTVSRNVSHIVLTLGTDGVTVTAPAAASSATASSAASSTAASSAAASASGGSSSRTFSAASCIN